MNAKDSGLISKLFSKEVVEQREKEELESVESSTRRNEKLLSLLSRKSTDQFQEFLSALDQTGQQHIANRIRGIEIPVTTG